MTTHVHIGRFCLAALAATLAAIVTASPAAAQEPSGEALYATHCAQCHDRAVPGAVPRGTLAALTADALRTALTTGAMQVVAKELSADQRGRIIDYLTAARSVATPPDDPRGGAGACPATGAPFAPERGPAWNGWGAGPAQQRFQAAEPARLAPEDVPRLRLKWAFGFLNTSQAYGQPAIIGGRVFVGSANRVVYSLDAASGCTHWAFIAGAPVRTAISVGSYGGRWLVFFGDQGGDAYALDALTGAMVWKTTVDDHPTAAITGAPVLAGGRLFVPMSSSESGLAAQPKYPCCTFRGSLSALDAATGRIVWRSRTISEEPKAGRINVQKVQNMGPSGAAVWSAPVVDLQRQRVYVVTGQGYSDPVAASTDAFLAFELDTGTLLWSRQVTPNDGFTVDCDFGPFKSNCPDANGPDFDLVSPLLVTLPNGRRALIAGQKSGLVHAVDPDRDGEPLWQQRVGQGGRLGGVHWGIASDGRHVFVANSDVQLMPAAAGAPGAQPAPGGLGFLAMNPTVGGGLFALDAETGRVVWTTPHPGCGNTPGCSPAQSAAVTLIPGVVFSGGLDGHIRAYDAQTGKIVWDEDTNREYEVVNRIRARGGAIDGPGVVVVGGTVYVSSGYAYVGTAPGNVLLAFSVDGR